MIKENYKAEVRENYSQVIEKDVVVIGGGVAGTCAAISAARAGAKVALIQDRPVLGGNASSEVRLWILGATSHMGNNNRWAREGGIMDEILVENLYRNKDGNALIFDAVLLEKVVNEPNITLLLNTSVYEVSKKGEKNIDSVKAFNSQNSTEYTIKAPVFIDSSGDGIVSFLAGAPFRMGAETKEEFGELFAPDESYGKMLGHTIYFYSKDAGKPVKYVAPSFALKEIEKIPRHKAIQSNMKGCQFWWFEYGGREADTIKTTEEIKWELWKVVYGVWDYIKNSGEFPEAENLTLEWVGTVPGKRESRRFEGEYMMKQQDIIEQKQFDDAIAFGGWAVDLHPADGVYSNLPGCTQWHSKGVYQIPYSAHISKTINNLYFTGRLISASHVAFGSTRVMATCGHGAQAIAQAAALCAKNNLNTLDILAPERMKQLQNKLNVEGQSIPGIAIDYNQLSLPKAKIEASSTYQLTELPSNGEWATLKEGFCQLLPLKAATNYGFGIEVKASKASTLNIELRKSSTFGNYTPDKTVETIEIIIPEGEQQLDISFEKTLEADQYAFVTLLPNQNIEVKTSDVRLSGTLSLFQKYNKAVSNHGKQEPPEGIGVDAFEFWTPKRRPEGKNMALRVTQPIEMYSTENLNNGFVRPYLQSNAWTASLEDKTPELTLSWDSPQKIKKVRLFFDNDYDHPMESVLMGHPEDMIPFCVKNYKVFDQNSNLLYEKTGNYQTINDINFDKAIETSGLKIQFEHPSEHTPASVFEIICFGESDVNYI